MTEKPHISAKVIARLMSELKLAEGYFVGTSKIYLTNLDFDFYLDYNEHSSLLSQAFIWYETTEGYDFWYEVNEFITENRILK